MKMAKMHVLLALMLVLLGQDNISRASTSAQSGELDALLEKILEQQSSNGPVKVEAHDKLLDELLNELADKPNEEQVQKMEDDDLPYLSLEEQAEKLVEVDENYLRDAIARVSNFKELKKLLNNLSPQGQETFIKLLEQEYRQHPEAFKQEIRGILEDIEPDLTQDLSGSKRELLEAMKNFVGDKEKSDEPKEDVTKENENKNNSSEPIPQTKEPQQRDQGQHSEDKSAKHAIPSRVSTGLGCVLPLGASVGAGLATYGIVRSNAHAFARVYSAQRAEKTRVLQGAYQRRKQQKTV